MPLHLILEFPPSLTSQRIEASKSRETRMEYLSIIYKPPGFNPQTQPQEFHEQTLDENNYIQNPTPIHLSSEHSLGQ